MRVRDVDSGEEVIQRPEMMDRSTTMSHDDERTLAIDIVDQELEEGVDCEGLHALSVLIYCTDSGNRGGPNSPRICL